jgi:hypothetical protein
MSALWYRLQLRSLHMVYIKQCYFLPGYLAKLGNPSNLFDLILLVDSYLKCRLNFPPPQMTKEQQCLRRHTPSRLRTSASPWGEVS